MASEYETDSQLLYHDVILSAGCLIDERDSGVLWPMKLSFFIGYCYDVILSAGCLIYHRDSGYVNGQ